MPSRVISARPRVIRPALPLSPKPSAVGRAGGDGDDVLERAAQLDAEDVLVDVQPEPTAAEARDDRARRASRSAAATTADAGRLRAISAARFGPDRAAIRPIGHAGGLGDDLAHPQERAALEALDDRQQVRRRRRGTARTPPTVVAQVGRRHGEDDEVGRRRGARPDRRSRRRAPAGRRPAVAPRCARSSRIRAAVSGEWQQRA